MMDMHRCIGCRFCMAACPYGARSFNYKDPRKLDPKVETKPEFPTRMKGVVEKCTLCYERLAKGLEPACVQRGAKTVGLIFGDLDDPHSEVRKFLRNITAYGENRSSEQNLVCIIYLGGNRYA